MANKEQDEATSLYICDEHGYGTNAMHNGAFSITPVSVTALTGAYTCIDLVFLTSILKMKSVSKYVIWKMRF